MKSPDNPAKAAEFKKFLEIIEDQAQFAHWAEIARLLGLDKNTITAWKNTPEAQAAIAKGINRALKEMETAGKKDWRMWEAKLKLLGMNPPTEIKHDLSDPIAELLGRYGLKDAGQTKKTKD